MSYRQPIALIDIETLSIDRQRACVISFAVLLIDPVTLMPLAMLYRTIKPQKDRVIDFDTRNWWKNIVAKKLRFAYRYGPGRYKVEGYQEVSFRTCLRDINTFLESWGCNKYVTVFGNGPEFDCEILVNAYAQYGIRCPWFFGNQQSVRTVRWLCDYLGIYKKGRTEYTEHSHHAAVDVIHELNEVRTALGKRTIPYPFDLKRALPWNFQLTFPQ